MRVTDRGIVYLLLNALGYSVSSLTFVKSGLQASQFLFWFGLIATTFAVITLILDNHFDLSTELRNRQIYLSLANGGIFGSLALFCHFKSLEFILPSDNNMVSVTFSLLTAVVLQSFEEHSLPSILTIISVFLGLTGTVIISNPVALVTENISQITTIKGVIFCSFVGIFLSVMFSNARKFDKITPFWSYFGYMLGILLLGLITADIGFISCSLETKILAAVSALLQAPAALFAILGLDLFPFPREQKVWL